VSYDQQGEVKLQRLAACLAMPGGATGRERVGGEAAGQIYTDTHRQTDRDAMIHPVP